MQCDVVVAVQCAVAAVRCDADVVEHDDCAGDAVDVQESLCGQQDSRDLNVPCFDADGIVALVERNLDQLFARNC